MGRYGSNRRGENNNPLQFSVIGVSVQPGRGGEGAGAGVGERPVGV